MASGNLSPRQKMIGMMYLVLTALLALNVSKEIINAFVVMNNGLEATNNASQAKNGILYSAFQNALANDEKKTQKWFDRAQLVKKDADALVKYIEELKADIKAETEGIDRKVADTFRLANISKLDDYDISTHYLIGSDPSNVTGKAKELKEKIEKYKKNLLAQLDPEEAKNYNVGMYTGDSWNQSEEKMVSWEWYNFYHLPIAAAVANLTKMQNDVRNAEGDMVNYLLKKVTAADFKFDTLAARVVSNSNYVLTGSEYRAEIFVAAFSSTSNPQVWLGEVDTTDLKNPKIKGAIDSTTVKVDRGVGVYSVTPSSEGEQKYQGIIRVKAPDNSYVAYPFKSAFMAARPAAVVSPTKMNVFYIGVENPVEISVPGVPAEKIKPGISSGTLSGGKGKYVVKVTKGPETTISVSADVNGKSTSMGSFKFRVKTVPDPVAYFAGKKNTDVITKSALLATQGVIAKMENFDFDLQFQVISFDLSMTINGAEVSVKSAGNALSAEQKTYLSKAKTGGKVYIENVKVKGPDGSLRTIGGVNLKIIG